MGGGGNSFLSSQNMLKIVFSLFDISLQEYGFLSFFLSLVPLMEPLFFPLHSLSCCFVAGCPSFCPPLALLLFCLALPLTTLNLSMMALQNLARFDTLVWSLNEKGSALSWYCET